MSAPSPESGESRVDPADVALANQIPARTMAKLSEPVRGALSRILLALSAQSEPGEVRVVRLTKDEISAYLDATTQASTEGQAALVVSLREKLEAAENEPAPPTPQSTEARADSCPSCGSTDPDTCRSSADPRRRPDGHGHPIAMRDKDWRKGGLMVDDSRFCCRDSFHEPASPSPQSTEARVCETCGSQLPLCDGDGMSRYLVGEDRRCPDSFHEPASPSPQSTEAREPAAYSGVNSEIRTAQAAREPAAPPQSTPEDRGDGELAEWLDWLKDTFGYDPAESADEARAEVEAVKTKLRETQRRLWSVEDDVIAPYNEELEAELERLRGALERLRGALERADELARVIDEYLPLGKIISVQAVRQAAQDYRSARADSASPTTEQQ